MNFRTAMLTSVMALGVSLAHAAPDDIIGTWRSIDDKTGFAKGIVQIAKEPDGTYSGTIVKTIPRPDYTPKEVCQNCPAPYTNKPIVGLKVLTGLKPDANNPLIYQNAQILDPLSGKVYKAKVKVSPDGRRLSMRGYVGVSMLGRSQSWFREE